MKNQLLKRAFSLTVSFALVLGNISPGITVYGKDDVDDTRILDMSFEGNLQDSSGNEFHGTIVGSGYEYIEGVKSGSQALKFNGDTYLSLGNDSALNPSSLTYSFWVKRTQDMTGEEIFLWNKEEWFTDGWYVASESNEVPLAISIGQADAWGQPYKVSVSANRAEFFTKDDWVHIAITYDKSTKNVKMYRNGIEQTTTIASPIGSTGATGVILPGNTMQKAIGYNGPKYNGAYAKFGLDEMLLLGYAAEPEDIISLYEESKPYDYTEGINKDAAALVVNSTTTKDLKLVTTGKNGSTITWVSGNETYLKDTGEVTCPEEGSVSVTLTATISHPQSTYSTTRVFEIVIKSIGTLNLQNNGIDKVELLDSYLVNAANKDIEYLLFLKPEKFLYEFFKVAGLKPTTNSGYGGWERSDATNFRGHFFGNYMTALSQAYLGNSNENTKAALLEHIETAVDGLQSCQDAYAAEHPESAGYISAFRESLLDYIEGTGTTDENAIVPWWTLDTILAGLIDIAKNVGGNVGAQALEVAKGLGDYIYYSRASTWSESTKLTMLRTEYGAMNLTLYDLYDITGDTNYKDAAECFDEIALFRDLYNGNDVLSGKHANTMIPKLMGALKRYTVLSQPDYYADLTEDEKAGLDFYLTAAENFWDIVIENHTYITGGNSQAEHFRTANALAANADHVNCETCNSYNMLKLSRELFKLTKDVKYADYYENTYINSILSSQNPETGMMMYFQPMAPGYYKVYNTPEESFWCCTATGVESFTKLGDSIYFPDGNDLYVNMYFSSAYEDGGIKITQEANMPNEDKVKIKVDSINTGTVLRLRQPDWIANDAQLTKNNTDIPVVIEDGYIVVRNLTAGDVLELTLPMEVVAYDTPDDAYFVAFKYGPVVLSCGLGTNDLTGIVGAGIMVYGPSKDVSALTTINISDKSVEDWKADVKNNLVRIEDSEDGKVQFKLRGTDEDDNLVYTPYYMCYLERYGIYMYIIDPDSPYIQEQILEKKRAIREKEVSSSYISTFDNNNSELSYNVKYESSGVGSYNGRTYRDAESNGWFSYDLKVNEEATKNYLSTTYVTADNGRRFDIYINNQFFITETISNTGNGNEITSDNFYTERREIPKSYLTNGDAVTVKFVGKGTTHVGGLYGISINSDYDTNPDLKDLTFTEGSLDKAFNGQVKEYTLTVPQNIKSVSMKATPIKESGLVYIGEILFDDTQPRTINLENEETVLTLGSVAQDHDTKTVYTVRIVKSSVKVTGITLNPTGKTLKVGESFTITADVVPANADNKSIIYSSDNNSVASVNGNKVTAKAAGTAIITAKAQDGSGVKATLTVTVQKEAVLTAPKSVKATQKSAKAVKVTWSKVTGAKQYDVYRSSKAGTGFVKIGNTTANSYTDKKAKAGKTFYYKVVAVSTSLAANSPKSGAAKVTLMKAPSVKLTAGKNQVKVSWKKIKGTAGYEVYMSTKETKGFKRKATLTKSKNISRTIKKLKSGGKYYFKVRAYKKINGKKVFGDFSKVRGISAK